MSKKSKKGAIARPLVYSPTRPDFFGSRATYGLAMWFFFALSVRTIYCAWPSIATYNGNLMSSAPTLYGLLALTIAGYAVSLMLGIFGMFFRPGDKDNDPSTVDHSIEVPPSGAPAHGLREKGYIFPDLANPFTLFYLYKKVVDVVLPDNSLCHQERWMWSWMRGQGNLMETPRKPSDGEVNDMKRGGVYNDQNASVSLDTEKKWLEALSLVETQTAIMIKALKPAPPCPTDSERAGSPSPTQVVNPDLAKAIDALLDTIKVITAQNKALGARFDALLVDYRRRQGVITKAAKEAAREVVAEALSEKFPGKCSCEKVPPVDGAKKIGDAVPKNKTKK